MTDRIKVVFTLPSLAAGGAQRVMSYIAQHMNENKFDVTLLVIGNKRDAAYTTENVETVFMGNDRVRSSFLGLVKYIRKHRPDVVISSISHLNTMMAFISVLFPKIKFVGRETMVLSATMVKPKRFRLKLFRIQKHLLDAMICQSIDMREDLMENYGFPREKLVTINNPVNDRFKLKSIKKPDGVLNLTSVGRLEKHKGYVRILDTLAKLELPFHYRIIGSGTYKNNIEKAISKLELNEKVEFVGFTDKVENYLQDSDIYLHGSYLEGFPNVLLESCAVGTPVIAFDAPGGINEIVQHGINGYVASTGEEFLRYIYKIAKETNMTPENIRKSVVDKYSSDKILRDYEGFIINLAKK